MPNVSRRSFVELLTGALASLPVTAGGLVLAPRPARADEADSTDASELAGLESEWVVIDVVEPWEVGFMVVDITKGEQLDGGLVRYPPVEGAKVTVTSRFNGNSAEGTTNENGVANIDVRQLSVVQEGEDVNKLSSYQFNGSVTVERDDYRKFRTGKLVVEGGTGLQVPAHPLDTDEGTPYPYLVSFDEWDALYGKNDFNITPANDDEHAITAQMLGFPTQDEVTMELWVEGEGAPRMSARATPGESVEVGARIDRTLEPIYVFQEYTGENIFMGFQWVSHRVPVHGRPAIATFEAPFLKEGDAACLPVSAKLKLVVVQGGVRWAVPLAVTTSKGVVDEPAGKEGQRLSPINTSLSDGSGLDVMWPSGIPIMGGGNLKFWAPELPINIYVNPYGLVQLTLKFPSWGYKNDNGKDEDKKDSKQEEKKSNWKFYPRQSVEDQWKKKVNDLKVMKAKTEALVSKPGAIQQLDLFRSFSVTANFQLMALAKWDADKGLFQGEAGGQLVIALNFTLSENFFAGPVPVLITFALDASLTFGLTAAAYSAKKNDKEALVDAVFDFSRWKWDYANTGFTMTLNVTPSLSVGLGIRGIASISVKGTVTLTLFLGVPMGTQPEGLPNPHFTAGWSAKILLVFEFFLFTNSFALFNKEFSNFYDNWDGEDKGIKARAEEEAQAARAALADQSLDELLADLQPITDEMLAQTNEAAITAQSLSAQAEGEPAYIDWAALAETGATQTLPDGTTVAFRQEVVQFDDGSSMTIDVYELSEHAAVDEQQERTGEVGQQDAAGTEQEGQSEQEAASTPEVAPGEAVSAIAMGADATQPEGSGEATEHPAVAAQDGDVELEAQGSADAQGGDATPVAQSPDSGSTQGGDATDPQALDSADSRTQDANLGPQDQDQAAAEGQGATAAQGTDADDPQGQDAVATQGEGPTDAQGGEAGEVPAPDADLEAQAQSDAAVTWLQAQASDGLPGPGVASLGSQAGIRPSSDLLLFGSADKHVLSAAHAKVLDIGAPVGGTHDYGDGVWCFRIASVEVGGRPRTRVVANCIEGVPRGMSKVIEVDTRLEGMPHDELYDYDFDVMARQENMPGGQSASVVSLVILSGRRDGGDGTTLAAASTDLVISHVRILSADFAGAAGVLRGGDAGCFSMRASDIANRDQSKPHSISNIRISDCAKVGTGFDFSLVFFLDRFADTAEDVLGSKATVSVGALMVERTTDRWGAFTFFVDKYPASWWHDNVGDMDPTVYEADFTPTSYVYEPLFGVPFFLMLRGAERAHYVRCVLPDYRPDGHYRLYPPQKCGDLDPSVRLVWCAALNGFLASYPDDPAQLDLAPAERDHAKWSLHKITWTNDRSPQMQVEPIGPAGFNVVNFAVNPHGTFLFWPHTRDADEDRVFDPEGKEDVRERPSIYQIMACRIRDGRFSDPFVVADLPTDTDMLAALSVNNAAVMEALRTEYVDTGERGKNGQPLYHAANIWYTSVPAVRCVTATACEAPDPFVAPGGQIEFHVAVRNDGNTFLSGCTLELCVHNEETNGYERVPGASVQLTFNKDTIQESTYNPSDGNGGLKGTEVDYALAPGKTSVYAVIVTVPKDWAHSDRKVLFVASEGVVAAGYSGVGAQAEDEQAALDAGAVEFHVEPGEYKVVQVRTQAEQDPERRHMDMLSVRASGAGGELFQPAPVTSAAEQEGSGTPTGTGAGTTAAGPNRAPLPYTGDETPGGLLGAGLAAAGAAVLAYERRRAENER